MVGASVSAGFLAPSPGHLLIEASEGAAPEKTACFGCGSSAQVHKLVSAPKTTDTVVGIDLFFWDIMRGRCQEAVENFRKLKTWAQREKVHLILGNTPEVGSEGTRSCARQLNEEMAAVSSQQGLTVVKLDRLSAQLEAQQGFEAFGHKYSLEEIRPDGLHFSRTGSILLAEEILKELDRQPPVCSQSASSSPSI